MDQKTMPKKVWFAKWWIWVVIFIGFLILVGLVWFAITVNHEITALEQGLPSPSADYLVHSTKDPTATGEGSTLPRVDVSIEDRPSQGNPDANIVIVEFGDFQCPFCKQAYPTTRKVMLEHKDEILFVYRHFPLTSIHPEAQKAAEAAECAFDQDKFWEYHDQLFLNQDDLSEDALKQYAQKVGLDANEFQSCLDSGEKAAIVQKDVDDGRRAGVSATPTFFINGNRIAGALPEEFFTQAINYLK